MNEKSTIQEALEFLERYRFDRKNNYPPRLSLLYDNNEGLRNALLIVFEDFEYPDFSHKVMKDILKKAYDIHQDMPRVIERDYIGVRAYPRKDISPDEAATFKFAVKNYGHFVDLNTSMTALDWMNAIKKNYDASTSPIAEVLRVIGKAMNAYPVPQHGKDELRWHIYSETQASESEDLAGFWSNDDGWTTFEGATVFASPPVSMPSIGAPDARLIPEVEAQLIVAQDVILQLQEALDSQATQISQMKGMFDDSDGAIERALEEAEEADTRAFKFLSALEQSLALADDHQISSSSPAMGM